MWKGADEIMAKSRSELMKEKLNTVRQDNFTQSKEVQQTPKSKQAADAKSKHKLASFYVSVDDLARYKAFASVLGITTSALVGTAVKAYVDGYKLTPEQQKAFDALIKL